MRCGIVNRSRDSPALFAGRGRERSELGEGRGIVLNAVPKLAGRSDRAKQMPRVQARRLSTREFCCRASAVPCPSPEALAALRLRPLPVKNGERLRAPAANRRASCRTKFCESCLNFKVGCDFPTIDRGHCIIYNLQFFPGCEIVAALQFALDLLCNGNKFVLSLFRPGLNSLQKAFQIRRGHNEIVSRRRRFSNRYGELLEPRFPNASTCRPSRLRTIQNSSTVSNTSEIEVAAAAPWPPKRGTSATQSTTFMTNASA